MIFEYTETNFEKLPIKSLKAKFVVKNTFENLREENFDLYILANDRKNKQWKLCRINYLEKNYLFSTYSIVCSGEELEKLFIISVALKDINDAGKLELCEFNVVLN